MRPMLFVLAFAALSVVWWPTEPAAAEESKVARGTVAEIGGRWVVLTVGDHQMRFDVDNTTTVGVRGAPTKARQATARGTPGPHLDGLLKVGQAVAGTYDDTAGSPRATRILAISAASVARGTDGMTSAGVVIAVGVDTITISGSGPHGAALEQTFMIDSNTKLFAKGASTATAATGGRAPLAEFVQRGDRVSIAHRSNGHVLVASDIHVTLKASR